jgi:hypothetical protein
MINLGQHNFYFHTDENTIEASCNIFIPSFNADLSIDQLDFEFTSDQIKGNIESILNFDSIIAIESDEFFVEKSVVTKYDVEFDGNKPVYFITFELLSRFITDSELDNYKILYKRKRTLNKLFNGSDNNLFNI